MGGQGSHLGRCKSGGTRGLNVAYREQISGTMQVPHTGRLCNTFEINLLIPNHHVIVFRSHMELKLLSESIRRSRVFVLEGTVRVKGIVYWAVWNCNW
jgi:hypothetical protein